MKYGGRIYPKKIEMNFNSRTLKTSVDWRGRYVCGGNHRPAVSVWTECIRMGVDEPHIHTKRPMILSVGGCPDCGMELSLVIVLAATLCTSLSFVFHLPANHMPISLHFSFHSEGSHSPISPCSSFLHIGFIYRIDRLAALEQETSPSLTHNNSNLHTQTLPINTNIKNRDGVSVELSVWRSWRQ